MAALQNLAPFPCMSSVFPGVVVPVGGTKEGDHAEIPIVPGDSFVDGPSGKLVRVHSGLVSGGRVKPSAGGYQSLLDATVLACEARAVDVLREYKDAVHASGRDLGVLDLLSALWSQGCGRTEGVQGCRARFR